jgi:putative peptidoglycan lipid II flippase
VSRHAAVDDVPGIRDTLSRGLAMMLMVNVPATAGLLALATPIVRLLFERGHFLAADTDATAAAVRLYALGLVGYSTARIAAPTFYALGRSRTPVIVSVGTVALNVGLSLLFARVLGFVGLALSTSIAAIANGGVLVLLLRSRLGGLGGRRLGVALVKITIASVAMSAAAIALERGALFLFPGRGVAVQILRLTAAIGGAFVALAGAAVILRIAEFAEVRRLAQSRVRKLLSS